MKTVVVGGFSLIEVLIAVFVLTVGVIGAAGMQLSALRTTQQSGFHTRAMHLAAEMAGSMRANLAQMRPDDADNPYLHVDHQAPSSAMPMTGRDCYRADGDCDAQQLAAFDIAQWLQRLDVALPGGRVRICRDAMLWHAAENNFSWDCKDSASITAPIVIKIGWRGKNAEDGISDQDGDAFAPRLALIVAPYVK